MCVLVDLVRGHDYAKDPVKEHVVIELTLHICKVERVGTEVLKDLFKVSLGIESAPPFFNLH